MAADLRLFVEAVRASDLPGAATFDAQSHASGTLLSGCSRTAGLDNRPFDGHDLGRLLTHRAKLPGADDSTPLVVVSRAGSTTDGVHLVRPERLLEAWRTS